MAKIRSTAQPVTPPTPEEIRQNVLDQLREVNRHLCNNVACPPGKIDEVIVIDHRKEVRDGKL